MAKESTTKRTQNEERTITLPITEEQYAEILNDPRRFATNGSPRFTRIIRNCFRRGLKKGMK